MRIFLSMLLIFIVSCSGNNQDENTLELDQAKKALDDARRYTENGDYEKALERHIWFHDNALKIRPSYYGVRLSFALADWVCLGEKYPKAMEALINIRDQKEAKLLSGEYNRELFHDVEAINEHLKNTEKTVQIFKTLDSNNPEFAKLVYDIASDSLYKAKQFDLARKYLGEPLERLECAKKNYLSGLEFAKKNGNHTASREAFERIFTNEVVHLIVVLDKSGERDFAKKIQRLSLEIYVSKEIKDALNDKTPNEQL